MRAIRIKPHPLEGAKWSSDNPATSDMLEMIHDLPLPKPERPGDILVQVKAMSVVRDNLTWPEMYSSKPADIGNDFAGVVIESLSSKFKPGDEVLGMISAERGGAWSESVLVNDDELCRKAKSLSWEQAGILSLGALTADQALFVHAGMDQRVKRRVLITGASGAVGICLVQFATQANQDVVAATSSNLRNEGFLRSLGVERIIEYSEILSHSAFDIIIDTVGGEVLKSCWQILKPGGTLISVDSGSWNFVKEHRALGLCDDHSETKATFFIVEPSNASLQRVMQSIDHRGIHIPVSKVFKFDEYQQAYDAGNSRTGGRGRVALLV